MHRIPDGRSPYTVKQPALGSQGMVTSNHPLASLAGVEMLMAGGNAVDAAIATMFALTVVEPMMVTIFGAGFVNIRLADGTAVVIDNYATVPSRATPEMFEPVPGSIDHEVTGDLNATGHLAVATGGTLKGWALAVAKYGRLPLADVVAPAVRHARNGFRVSPYLRSLIEMNRDRLARYPDSAKVFLPGGQVPEAGGRIRRPEYADTLETIGREGADYLYDGPLGRAIASDMAANGGLVSMEDIRGYQVFERPPARGTAFGHEVCAPPPPSSGGAHIVQMLKILEGFPIREWGFGAPDTVHLVAEAMKIAFADRFRYMADPATTAIPLEWLMSDAYAAERGRQIDLTRAQEFTAGVPPDREAESTTHCTAMDADGNVVATTNTLHYGFGSAVTVPETGMLLNNCMQLMDPVPGRTNSIAPGKRILSSMSPSIVLREGEPLLALGLPGGLKIFGSVLQGLLNVLVHGMTLQQAVEAPRLFDRGHGLELERGFPDFDALAAEMTRRGHRVLPMFKVAGGMNGLMRRPGTGLIEGAACWRADGAPAGFSGGDALVEEGEAGWR
jgi:gamma-glutamyltranspeptidase/glutathione hydrolase